MLKNYKVIRRTNTKMEHYKERLMIRNDLTEKRNNDYLRTHLEYIMTRTTILYEVYFDKSNIFRSVEEDFILIWEQRNCPKGWWFSQSSAHADFSMSYYAICGSLPNFSRWRLNGWLNGVKHLKTTVQQKMTIQVRSINLCIFHILSRIVNILRL